MPFPYYLEPSTRQVRSTSRKYDLDIIHELRRAYPTEDPVKKPPSSVNFLSATGRYRVAWTAKVLFSPFAAIHPDAENWAPIFSGITNNNLTFQYNWRAALNAVNYDEVLAASAILRHNLLVLDRVTAPTDCFYRIDRRLSHLQILAEYPREFTRHLGMCVEDARQHLKTRAGFGSTPTYQEVYDTVYRSFYSFGGFSISLTPNSNRTFRSYLDGCISALLQSIEEPKFPRLPEEPIDILKHHKVIITKDEYLNKNN